MALKRVLFVCIGNACRSQMAEGFARAYGADVMIPASAGLAPAMNVARDTKTAMAEKDIDIRLENNLLTVRGERKLEKETKEENYHRIERSYGSFTRSFSLPNTVNTEEVKAAYTKGVLTINLGKRAEARPKQIKVDITPEIAEKTVSGK